MSDVVPCSVILWWTFFSFEVVCLWKNAVEGSIIDWGAEVSFNFLWSLYAMEKSKS